MQSSARWGSHEIGHSAGLKHPFHGANQKDIGGKKGSKTYKNNLMNTMGGSRNPKKNDYNPIPSTLGHNISKQQLQTVINEIRNDTKNKK